MENKLFKIRMKIQDMPKLQSPFIRKMIKGRYLVTSEIDPEYKWVFDDNDVIATEKLDGTSISIIIEKGQIISVWNRTENIPFFNKGKRHIIEGVLESFCRGYCRLPDGQHFGEIIGKKLKNNPYNIDGHIWIPFNTYIRTKLYYKYWGKYPKDFESISKWFQDDIFSLFLRRKGIKQFPEGIVFVQPSTGKMAKLRRDMFEWYSGVGHKQPEK